MTRVIESKSTTGLNLYDGVPTDETLWGWINDHLIDWMGEICDPQLGTITNPGSGYVDGVYPNVELRRTASTQTGGNNLLCEVTVSGGGVSSVTITQKGNGFKTGDELNIPNVAQVGGSGSGFTIEVSSADASLGFIYDVTRAGSSYPKGWLIGAERGNHYSRGFWLHKSSNTSTTYAYDFYAHTQSTSNNGYGSYDYVHSPSMSVYTDSNGDGYLMQIAYSTDPGDRWFIYTDNAYDNFWYLAELNQPAGPAYPDTSLISKWGTGYGSTSMTFRPFSTVSSSTPFFATRLFEPPRPTDANALFAGGAIYGRGYLAGVLPPGIGYHTSFTGWEGRQLQQGTEVWDAFGHTMFVRTAL